MDWKGLGYLVSIVSVLLLGAVAWSSAAEPPWHKPILIAGMATSVLGMAFRYLSHRREKRELQETERMAALAGDNSTSSSGTH